MKIRLKQPDNVKLHIPKFYISKSNKYAKVSSALPNEIHHTPLTVPSRIVYPEMKRPDPRSEHPRTGPPWLGRRCLRKAIQSHQHGKGGNDT